MATRNLLKVIILFAHRQIKCPIVFNIVKVLKSKIPIKADRTIIVVVFNDHV